MAIEQLFGSSASRPAWGLRDKVRNALFSFSDEDELCVRKVRSGGVVEATVASVLREMHAFMQDIKDDFQLCDLSKTDSQATLRALVGTNGAGGLTDLVRGSESNEDIQKHLIGCFNAFQWWIKSAEIYFPFHSSYRIDGDRHVIHEGKIEGSYGEGVYKNEAFNNKFVQGVLSLDFFAAHEFYGARNRLDHLDRLVGCVKDAPDEGPLGQTVYLLLMNLSKGNFSEEKTVRRALYEEIKKKKCLSQHVTALLQASNAEYLSTLTEDMQEELQQVFLPGMTSATGFSFPEKVADFVFLADEGIRTQAERDCHYNLMIASLFDNALLEQIASGKGALPSCVAEALKLVLQRLLLDDSYCHVNDIGFLHRLLRTPVVKKCVERAYSEFHPVSVVFEMYLRGDQKPVMPKAGEAVSKVLQTKSRLFVRRCVDIGMDKNIATPHGYGLVHHFSVMGDVSMLRYLAGLDDIRTDAADTNGYNALFFAPNQATYQVLYRSCGVRITRCTGTEGYPQKPSRYKGLAVGSEPKHKSELTDQEWGASMPELAESLVWYEQASDDVLNTLFSRYEHWLQSKTEKERAFCERVATYMGSVCMADSMQALNRVIPHTGTMLGISEQVGWSETSCWDEVRKIIEGGSRKSDSAVERGWQRFTLAAYLRDWPGIVDGDSVSRDDAAAKAESGAGAPADPAASAAAGMVSGGASGTGAPASVPMGAAGAGDDGVWGAALPTVQTSAPPAGAAKPSAERGAASSSAPKGFGRHESPPSVLVGPVTRLDLAELRGWVAVLGARQAALSSANRLTASELSSIVSMTNACSALLAAAEAVASDHGVPPAGGGASAASAVGGTSSVFSPAGGSGVHSLGGYAGPAGSRPS